MLRVQVKFRDGSNQGGYINYLTSFGLTQLGQLMTKSIRLWYVVKNNHKHSKMLDI